MAFRRTSLEGSFAVETELVLTLLESLELDVGVANILGVFPKSTALPKRRPNLAEMRLKKAVCFWLLIIISWFLNCPALLLNRDPTAGGEELHNCDEYNVAVKCFIGYLRMPPLAFVVMEIEGDLSLTKVALTRGV